MLRFFLKKRLSFTSSRKVRSRSRFLKNQGLILQGADSVIVVEKGVVSEMPVIKLDKEKIVDTNGAGDAFVGGLLAQLAKGAEIKKAIECGLWAAAQVRSLKLFLHLLFEMRRKRPFTNVYLNLFFGDLPPLLFYHLQYVPIPINIGISFYTKRHEVELLQVW